MSDSIENKLRNLSKSVEKPMPTLFQAGEGLDEGIMVKKPGGPNPNTGSDCADIARGRDDSYVIFMVYTWIINQMYCRRNPLTDDINFCYPVSVGLPVDGSIEGEGQVTTRDEPLRWQRLHPDFDPANPATWGSVFGPGGLAEKHVRFFQCQQGNDGLPGTGPCPGLTDADINATVEIIRQLYIRRCGFAVTETGACCFPAGDFGGFSCVQTNSEADCAARSGTFYSGQTCKQIGGDNCALAPNPQKAKSQILAAKEIASAVIRKLKDRK